MKNANNIFNGTKTGLFFIYFVFSYNAKSGLSNVINTRISLDLIGNLEKGL